jgi:hypothetical protein
MLLCVRPLILLACTAVAFLTMGRAPGAVNLRRQDLDLGAAAQVEADTTY